MGLLETESGIQNLTFGAVLQNCHLFLLNALDSELRAEQTLPDTLINVIWGAESPPPSYVEQLFAICVENIATCPCGHSERKMSASKALELSYPRKVSSACVLVNF